MKKSTNFLVESIQELWRYRDLLKQLVVRDIKLKYRRSFLGYAFAETDLDVLRGALCHLCRICLFREIAV